MQLNMSNSCLCVNNRLQLSSKLWINRDASDMVDVIGSSGKSLQ